MNNVTRKTLLKSQQTRFDWPGEYNVPTTVVNTTYAMPNHRALGCLQKIELINLNPFSFKFSQINIQL